MAFKFNFVTSHLCPLYADDIHPLSLILGSFIAFIQYKKIINNTARGIWNK